VQNHGPSILVIDDDPSMRLLLCRGLEGQGFHVIEACSGVGCAESLVANRVAAVICDLFMPRKDGFATIMDIRKVAPHVPIIAMSGRNQEPQFDLLITQALGADETLAKPFRLTQLYEALESCGVWPLLNASGISRAGLS
jgi:two-component system, OmpR family, response regulator